MPSLRTSSRYSEATDNALSVIAQDLEIEDAALRACIEQGRLGEWWKGIVDAAQSSVRNEADRNGEEESKRAEGEQMSREKKAGDDGAAWKLDGMEKKKAAGGRWRLETDEEGDVIME